MKGVNNIKREIAPKAILPDVGGMVDNTISWKQGDLLFYDDTNALVKPIATEATDALACIGVAQQSVTEGKVDGPYTGLTDTQPGGGNIAGPLCGVEAEFTLKTGDSVDPGALMYAVDGDPQQVSSAGTKEIGLYTGRKSISGAAAGTKVLVHVGHRYPADFLVL